MNLLFQKLGNRKVSKSNTCAVINEDSNTIKHVINHLTIH